MNLRQRWDLSFRLPPVAGALLARRAFAFTFSLSFAFAFALALALALAFALAFALTFSTRFPNPLLSCGLGGRIDSGMAVLAVGS